MLSIRVAIRWSGIARASHNELIASTTSDSKGGRGSIEAMDFNYTPEQERFRAELRSGCSAPRPRFSAVPTSRLADSMTSPAIIRDPDILAIKSSKRLDPKSFARRWNKRAELAGLFGKSQGDKIVLLTKSPAAFAREIVCFLESECLSIAEPGPVDPPERAAHLLQDLLCFSPIYLIIAKGDPGFPIL